MYTRINEDIVKETSTNPVDILLTMVSKDYISIHGPEHHYLDGASLLVSYYNKTKSIDLNQCLEKFSDRAKKMPGAMCGLWGICGSSASIGAALSIIHETGPLSNDEHYKEHMMLTSSIISKQASIGGPRCCKRNGYIALLTAIDFIKETYKIELEKSDIHCQFSTKNKQCIKERCPFYK